MADLIEQSSEEGEPEEDGELAEDGAGDEELSDTTLEPDEEADNASTNTADTNSQIEDATMGDWTLDDISMVDASIIETIRPDAPISGQTVEEMPDS
ncbi:hypothetical protein EJ08DRAFT_646540 [Tothia fuscella]|uniref:Uncharacterized protein n=1 Tax=Tothia fuscella TaxID=1048955 RepID=A0A9P4P0A5_9PEZI|nr:hypothetical protein EJ08DRAFT_646540 [Tothia fuscella]